MEKTYVIMHNRELLLHIMHLVSLELKARTEEA